MITEKQIEDTIYQLYKQAAIVLGDDVNKCLSNHSISSYKEVDVLAALAVEEFVVDGTDGSVCV